MSFSYTISCLWCKTHLSFNSHVSPPLLEVFTVDGKLFAIPNTAAPSVYVFNADLFDQSGLSYPSDLYRQDAWTWSAFREMARSLRSKRLTVAIS